CPPAHGLPPLPAPDLPRVRRALGPAIRVGRRLLPPAEGPRTRPPRGGAVAGLQVDPRHLPLLEGADALRRGDLPGVAAAKGPPLVGLPARAEPGRGLMRDRRREPHPLPQRAFSLPARPSQGLRTGGK